MNATFRPASAADEPLLRELTFTALYVAPGQAPFPRSILDQPDIRHYFAGFGSRPGDLGSVAVVDGVDVGAAWVRVFPPDDPGYGWVDVGVPEVTIAVDATCRDRGIGRALLAEVRRAASAAGYERIGLSVDPGSPAVRLYESVGFVRCGADGSSITMVATTR